jgi:EAL domain-containing protein (putative c-di-GMP-specific phosphodiesterase class I)
LVTPDSIISMAEESGLILPLSEWIIRTACKQVRLWHEDGHQSLRLALNISPRQFKDANFVSNVVRAMKETEFQPEFLVIEIKESLIMHDPVHAIKLLVKLKQAGVSIVIDDFGTGFSSFTYLSSDSVDKIKIDKVFIQRLTESANDVAIVSAMIAMVKKLGIKSVAEGVETKEQYDILVKEGCDEVQGYFIAKPLPTDLMESYLSTRLLVSHDIMRSL